MKCPTCHYNQDNSRKKSNQFEKIYIPHEYPTENIESFKFIGFSCPKCGTLFRHLGDKYGVE